MSYALGLGRSPEKRPAALLPLSGFMPDVEGLELDLTGLEGFPVAIAHGTLDPVIPVDYSRAARDVLTAAGADVAYHESPLGAHDRPADHPGAARLRRRRDRPPRR